MVFFARDLAMLRLCKKISVALLTYITVSVRMSHQQQQTNEATKMTAKQLAALEARIEAEYRAEEAKQMAQAMKAVNELSKSMDMPTGRNYPAWNARKQEAAENRRMNSKPEDR